MCGGTCTFIRTYAYTYARIYLVPSPAGRPIGGRRPCVNVWRRARILSARVVGENTSGVHAHCTFRVLECWQRQSDCRIINVTWYKNELSVKRSARRKKCMCYIRCTHAVLTWLFRSVADSEVRIGKAISYATKALGYSELRLNRELAVNHFLRGHGVFVSLPTGSGKSLCYCLLPKTFDFLWQRIESTQSIVVVVSPPSCPQISEA